MLSCGCKHKESSTIQQFQKSSRLEANTHIEGSDTNLMTVHSCKSPVMGSSDNMSLENKSPHIQVGSCSVMNKDLEGKLVSVSMGMNAGKSLDFISSKSSSGKNCSSVCDTGSCLLKASNLEGIDSLPRDNSTKLPGDSLVQANLTAPLITFSRRCKKKKDNEEADAKRSSLLEEKNCSSESFLTKWSKSTDGAASHKGSSGDHSTVLKLPREDRNVRHIFC